MPKTLKLSGNMIAVPLKQDHFADNEVTAPVVEPPLPQYFGLTQAQFNRFDSACHATWNTIASDVAGAAMEGDEDAKRTTSMPRSHVIEVVLDADYMRSYGEHGRGRTTQTQPWQEFYDQVIRPMLDKHYHSAKFKKMMKEVFPYGRYDT